jgi:hypothetical protein
VCALQIATATLMVKSFSMSPSPRSGRRCLYLAATLLPPGQHRRSLRALSPLWLPYLPWQFLQDSCPGRLPWLRHARHLRRLLTRGVPKAALRREAGVGAQATRGAPGAALRREVGAGAAVTRGTPGAALRRDVGARAQATRGAPGAALSQEARAGAAGTRGAPGAALSRVVGAGAAGTRDAPELPCAGRRVLEPRRHVAALELPEPGGRYHTTAPSSASADRPCARSTPLPC